MDVESHGYSLVLADGREILMDVSVEDDWGNVQECYEPGTMRRFVGWGDADEHVEIVDVFDCETEDHLDPLRWAEDDVWPLAGRYSG